MKVSDRDRNVKVKNVGCVKVVVSFVVINNRRICLIKFVCPSVRPSRADIVSDYHAISGRPT